MGQGEVTNLEPAAPCTHVIVLHPLSTSDRRNSCIRRHRNCHGLPSGFEVGRPGRPNWQCKGLLCPGQSAGSAEAKPRGTRNWTCDQHRPVVNRSHPVLAAAPSGFQRPESRRLAFMVEPRMDHFIRQTRRRSGTRLRIPRISPLSLPPNQHLLLITFLREECR